MTQAQEPIDDSDAPESATGSEAGLSRRTIGIAAAALVAVVAVAALLFSGGGDADVAAGGADGTGVSAINSFEFLTEEGSTSTLADFAGEPTVVNFYASWCAPCRAELPHFVDVNAQADGRVQFLGISHDIDESSWRALNSEFELNYPTVYQTNQEIFTELELLGMPATAFITADGEVAHTFTGVLNDETLKNLIAEHLGVEV